MLAFDVIPPPYFLKTIVEGMKKEVTLKVTKKIWSTSLSRYRALSIEIVFCFCYFIVTSFFIVTKLHYFLKLSQKKLNKKSPKKSGFVFGCKISLRMDIRKWLIRVGMGFLKGSASFLTMLSTLRRWINLQRKLQNRFLTIRSSRMDLLFLALPLGSAWLIVQRLLPRPW